MAVKELLIILSLPHINKIVGKQQNPTLSKLELKPEMDVDSILKAVEKHYQGEQMTTIDGVKIDFADSWVHLRKSNTEPIIRIYSEAHTMDEAERLGEDVKQIVLSLIWLMFTALAV